MAEASPRLRRRVSLAAINLAQLLRKFSSQDEAQGSDASSPGSPDRQATPRKPIISFKTAASAVVGHVKFKKKKQASGIDGARIELSFKRPEPSSSTSGVAHRSMVRRQSTLEQSSMPKFGEIQFTSSMTRFCIVGPNTDPQRFCEMVVQSQEMWHLESPKLLLSIMGGAGGMNLQPAVEAHFCEGLVGAAQQTGGWVITGGTDSGVMDLVGKAMHKHDPRRTVPCIGIAPFGACKEKWRMELEKEENGDTSETMFVEAPRKEDLIGDTLAGLQQHHTHCVLVDSGDRGMTAFGKELEFRECFEQYIARKLKNSARIGDSTQDSFNKRTDSSSSLTVTPSISDILRVMILVNGGPVSFQAMSNAIKHDCPVVVCDGSGRAADFVAALKLKRLADYAEAWTTHMTAPADQKMGIEGFIEGFEGGEKALRDIVESPCVTVYTTEDRLEEEILSAVWQHMISKNLDKEQLTIGLRRALELAVQWKCVRHYNKIGQQLVKNDGIASALNWMLGHFVRQWRDLDGGPLMKWIVETHMTDLKRLDVNALDPPGLQWTAMPLQKDTDKESAGTLAFLFIWLVENKASTSVVDVVWLELDYPAHGALAAASASREAADRLNASGGYGDMLDRQRMHAMADRSEELAVRLMTGLDRIDPLEYLFRRAARYANHHLISLAHHLKCKEFVSQQFYNTAVDILWATPTPFAVFAFDRDIDRRRRNLVTMPFSAIFTASFFWQLWRPGVDERVAMKDLFSVPRIKAFTHGVSRVLFICTYSYFVLFAEGVLHVTLSLLLLAWGLSLSFVEVLQYKAKNSFDEYLNVWNVLDLLVLQLLLGSLLLSWTIVPLGLMSPKWTNIAHALNLLPCYLRLLQIFELSEYFGTLLFTVFGMAQDTFHFLVLLGIISLGFSCALTPIFYPSVDARWEHGVSWGFWAIFGDVDLENIDKDLTWERHMIIGFLKYMLALTSNVLLVNLLIAMLNDTYIANKDASKREWAFNRVDAVLEFSSAEAHILPPPLDILVSLRSLIGTSAAVSRCNAEKYCIIERVVPVSAHEVEVYFEVVGAEFSIMVMEQSTLSWEGGGLPPDEVVLKEGVSNRGKIVFTDVPLTKALHFTFGQKELGYESVPIHLSEDTWRRPLNALERRQIKLLQQQVLNDERESKVEDKHEVIKSDFEQKLTQCTEEMTRLSQQVAELVVEQRSSAKRRDDCEADNAKFLRAEVERLQAHLDAVGNSTGGRTAND